MAHEPSIAPNFTLFIQMGIFFASFFVLRSLVFKPYLALLEARRAKTSGLREHAARDKERASKLQSDYEHFMKAERKKVAAWNEDERKKVSEEERAIIQKAREAVGEDMQKLREKIQRDTESARKELSPLVNEYSSQIASKLVGYKVHVSGTMELGAKDQIETTVFQ